MSYLKDRNNKNRNCLLVAAAIVIIMIICCAYSSPLYPYYYNGDVAIFMLIGKGISEGKICYVDLFDHKGPILFFIEALGWAIDGRTGIWFIECVGTIVSVALIIKTCKLLKSKWIWPTVATALVYLYIFGHGNLSENYSLPFVYVCLYLAAKYYTSGKAEHPLLYALVYGICFGILAFIRVNNALIICAVVLVIIVGLAKKKETKNLLLNILVGVVGIALASIPVCVYFYSKNALYDMIYCTFLYNLLYAGVSTHVSIFSSITVFFKYIVLYLPLVFSTAVFAYKVKIERSGFSTAMLVASSLSLLMLAYSNIYDHYFITAIPVFTVAVAMAIPEIDFGKTISEAKTAWKEKRNAWFLAVLLISVVYLPLLAYRTAAPIYKTYLTNIEFNRYSQISSSAEVIPKNERNSVIGYGIRPEWYVDMGITPCYKYYTMQKWWTTEHLDVYGEFIEFVKSEHPLWLLTKTDIDDEVVLQIINENYELQEENDYACFYRYIGDET